MEKINAIILLGNSNAGKTPLGEMLQQQLSRPGARFLHLDFGENLRAVAAGKVDAGLCKDDVDFVCSILNGTLLDNAHFYIAEAVITAFCRKHCFDHNADTLILNGIPRHAGQVSDLEKTGIVVRELIVLDCPAREAFLRKSLADAGRGHEDRSHRQDNAFAVFEKKIASFERDTRPLVASYERKQIPLITIPVTVATTAAEMAAAVLHRR